MRRLLTRTLLTIAGGAAAVALAASSASAATWTVVNGGSLEADAGMTTLVVHDPMAGDQTLSCNSSVATADVPNGDSNGMPVGHITGLTFNTCSLAGIIPFTVTSQNLPWDLNAVSQAGDVVTGTVTGPITAQITGQGSACSATVSGGSVPATYDNGIFQLKVDGGGDLKLSNVNVTGCLSRLHDGDSAEFHAAYDNVTDATTINQTG